MRTAKSVHFTLTKSTLAKASRQIAHSPFRATLKASNREKRPSSCANLSIRTGWRQPKSKLAGKGQNSQGQDHSPPAKLRGPAESVQAPQGFLLRDPELGNHDGNDLLAEIPSFLVNREREFSHYRSPFQKPPSTFDMDRGLLSPHLRFGTWHLTILEPPQRLAESIDLELHIRIALNFQMNHQRIHQLPLRITIGHTTRFEANSVLLKFFKTL